MKTYSEDFIEKHPNCAKKTSGRPSFCKSKIYGTYSCCHAMDCQKCWDLPVGYEWVDGKLFKQKQ